MKTLLKNGTIYDGSGAAPYVGDLLLEDDRILNQPPNGRAGRLRNIAGNRKKECAP